MLSDTPKHDTSLPHFRKMMEDFPEEIEEQVSWLVTAPSMAGMALDNIALETRICLSVDPRAAELLSWEAWTTWMQVAEAPFAMCALASGETVERVINQKTRTLHPLPPGPECDAGTWLTAFFLAVSCRDEKRVDSLCRITPEFLKEAGEKRGGAYDEYIYPWIGALQDFVLNRPALGDNLQRAMELSKPENASISSAEGLDHLVFPVMNAFYRLVRQDTAQFNEAMKQGIRLFRAYYTADEERAKDSEGTVPLHLFGVACMAYDLARAVPDFNPDLESPYLPKHILERTRYGEIAL
ncbi:immunity 49 family protein [Nocardiopsis lambiniae]|uniref:Immunity 49 family protein n=1 Tax=Nocardiopsis lambiniae TaxID=3075539 RepID=A0ABU2M2M7_9ACTN|nr:immunity 49 family protein [Nocardiopsis sp. DSM 44743]MDT0326818.1 immunity 49 family protein [Nocardiopsis sp. DSM 44743]